MPVATVCCPECALSVWCYPIPQPELGAKEQKEVQCSLPLNTLAQLLDGQIDVVGIHLQSLAEGVERASFCAG